MYKIEVHNCNNVSSSIINLNKQHLNIRYAMNGSGKSTIAKALEYHIKGESLSTLKTFGCEEEPTCMLSEIITNMMLFNDDFVNDLVFQESEVIQNAFEVFIKTPEYEEQLQKINEKLKNIRIEIEKNEDLKKLSSVGKLVLNKIKITQSGDLRQSGLVKSITDSQSIFQLPQKLTKFKPLMEKKYNVDWVSWKHEGYKYDDNNICPFCTIGFDEEYETEKELFQASYTKSNVKNIMEMIGYFNEVKDFMDEEKAQKLEECVKGTKSAKEINHWIKLFYGDLKYIIEKLDDVQSFNTYRIRKEDISTLEEQLKHLLIDITDLQIFKNKKVKQITDYINDNITKLLTEAEILKKDIGQLNGLVGDARKNAIKDINDFLEIAGINYEIEIIDEAENKTKTILKYKSKDKGLIDVEDINIHLSWGERNAFALVLFMHYALSHNPDIIILDDPISSFDSNKKYAIIHRIFSPKKYRSFFKKTVLFLTHDLQPLIDFLVINRPHNMNVSACFLNNKKGKVYEQRITESDIKSLPILLMENAKNREMNLVHRITCLRKYFEIVNENSHNTMEYNILSCLIHGEDKPRYLDKTEIEEKNVKEGEDAIRKYIPEFDYNEFLKTTFNRDSLVKIICGEASAYLRLQVFRVLVGILNIKAKMEDDPLMKYVDEQFHVENDYMFSLNFMKYDIVPEFVIPRCLAFLERENILNNAD